MRPRAYISHHIPGRVRIKVPDAKRNPALLEKMREVILSAPGVKTVDCNPLTGSLLIHYSAHAHENPAFLSGSNGFASPFSLDPPDPPRSNRSGSRVRRRTAREREPSEAAQAIREFFVGLDDAIRLATDNQLDLRVLLPVAAGVVGFVLYPKAISTPMWLTLTIFAFSSFLILHPPGGVGAELAELEAGLEL